MNLEQIIELVRQGVSDQKLREAVKDFQGDYANLAPGEFGDAIRDAKLSPEQSQQIISTFQDINPASASSQVGELAGLAGGRLLGAGVSAVRNAGSAIGVTEVAGGVAGAEKLIPGNAAANLLSKIAESLYKVAIPKGLRSSEVKTFGMRTAAGIGTRLGAVGAVTGNLPGVSDFSNVGASTAQAGASPTGEAVDRPFGHVTPQMRENMYQPGSVSGPSQASTMSMAPYGANLKKGFNVLVVDHEGQFGTPGAVLVLSPQDLGMTPGVGMDAMQQINGQNILTGDLLATSQELLGQSGGQLSSGVQGPTVFQMLFPEGVGSVQMNRPVSVQTTLGDVMGKGTSAGPPGSAVQTGPSRGGITPTEVVRPHPVGPAVDIPAGSQLSSRVLGEFGGRTMLEWASVYARKYQVPLNLLYGVIDHESGWKADAVGDNGTSFGLAQIHLTSDAYGGVVSKSQAMNPNFALDWTARKLRERFNHYGRWDAAVAAHNSPAAAEYLVNNGKFYNQKSALYVGDVFQRATGSALGNEMMPDLTGVEINSGGTGASFSPFQAPDPAATRTYVREVYQDILGRKPTEDELRAGVLKVNTLSRGAYNSNKAIAGGKSATAVDVGAQFEEGLSQSGEGQFQEETIQMNSFTDHAASIARLLQQGL